MLHCDCSFCCCIFNEALLFCINLEFLRLKTQAAPLRATACVLSDCEKATISFYFSNKSATDGHGNTEFLAEQPTSSLVADPSGGAFTRSLSAKHYAITNGLYRRQEAGAAGPLKAQQQPPPTLFFFFFFFFSPWIHLCPRMNSCFVTMQAHTHTQTHK